MSPVFSCASDVPLRIHSPSECVGGGGGASQSEWPAISPDKLLANCPTKQTSGGGASSNPPPEPC